MAIQQFTIVAHTPGTITFASDTSEVKIKLKLKVKLLGSAGDTNTVKLKYEILDPLSNVSFAPTKNNQKLTYDKPESYSLNGPGEHNLDDEITLYRPDGPGQLEGFQIEVTASLPDELGTPRRFETNIA